MIHLSAEGDKSARDLRVIRQEQSIRDGAHQASVFAGFEKYTKVSTKKYCNSLNLCKISGNWE